MEQSVSKQPSNYLQKRSANKIPKIGVGVAEAAEAIGVSPGFVRLEIQRGNFDTFRAGRRILIKKQSFDRYVAGDR